MKSSTVLVAALVVVLIIWMGTLGTGPMASLCEMRLRPTEVKVSTTPVTFSTDLTLPSARLTEMAATTTGRTVHGLTRTNMRSLVTVGSNGITNPLTGTHCLRPIVDVKLAFDPMTVFITSEQREGTCEFDVTMRHELQHVGVYRTFLDTAAADVASSLREHFGNRVFYFESPDQAQKEMSTETSHRIGPIVEETLARVQDLQAPLDTPEEYLRLERSCSRP